MELDLDIRISLMGREEKGNQPFQAISEFPSYSYVNSS